MSTMRIAWITAWLQLAALATSASAGTLATGLMYWDGGNVTTSCFVTNVGKKPATLTSVTIQDDGSTDITPVTSNCSGPLPPGVTCFWDGPTLVYGGGRAEVKGSTKSLRGRCVLRDATNGDVLGSAADLR